MKKKLYLVPVLLLFLILSYDLKHHWDEVYYLYIASYDPKSIYLDPFLQAKWGHLLLLKIIIGFTGIGLNALFLIDLIYALMMIGFFVLSYELLRQLLDKDKARYITFFLMFMPLSMYLTFKTLSEVPALLFGTLSLLLFCFAIWEKNRWKNTLLILGSGVFLSVATIMRLDSSILFFSFLIGLLCYDTKFRSKKILFNSLMVSLILILNILLIFVLFKINQFTYLSIANETISKPQNIDKLLITVSETFYEGSFMFIFVVFSLFNYKEKIFRFAFFWAAFASLPILIFGLDNSRFLSWNLIPLSILAFQGLKELFEKIENLYREKIAIAVIISLLIGILIGNQFFIGNMKYEVVESDYKKIFNKMETNYGSKDRIILIPYAFTDYSFLKFAYPKEKIFLVEGITQDGNESLKEKFGYDYLSDLKSIESISNNSHIFYITWYKEKDYILYKGKGSGTYDRSWLTKEPRIILEKVFIEGQYTLYSVDIISI